MALLPHSPSNSSLTNTSGKLVYVRVYSGTLNALSNVLNSSQGKKQRIGRILRMYANRQEIVDTLYSGEIGAVVGLNDTATGDTICSEDAPIVLEAIEFPAPVLSITVSPEKRPDREKMGQALSKLAEEDPTFVVSTDPETDDTIIAGMGELHLDIIVDRLRREFGVQIQTGTPQVAYRETITTSIQVNENTRNRAEERGSSPRSKSHSNRWDRARGSSS